MKPHLEAAIEQEMSLAPGARLNAVQRKRYSDCVVPGWVVYLREKASPEEREMMRKPMNNPEAVADLVRSRISPEVVEVMYAIGVNVQNKVLYMQELSRGGISSCVLSSADILRTAIATASSAIILVHNHPSGVPSPSKEDLDLTRRVNEAVKCVGLQLLDHVIVGGLTGDYFSFRSRGLL